MAIGNDYLKLPNQGNIISNIRLLYEMKNSDGYADSQGYFTKMDIAEIASNSLLITTGNKIGKDVVASLRNENQVETDNSPLQNTKMRMQLLRILGLVSTDYDSEIYAITKFGEMAIEQIFSENPNYNFLLELFMNITTVTEIYEHNCDIKFNCYIGYQICYAFASLDYRISTTEMPVLTTYDISEIASFVEDAKKFREAKMNFPVDHIHFPKTNKGKPLNQASNLTRTINQILRICGIIKEKSILIDGIRFYECTEFGKEYVDEIKKKVDFQKLSFILPYQFRRKNILEQKEICRDGINNILVRSGIDNTNEDTNTVFSPYQLIPETNVNWLLGENLKKHPDKKEGRMEVINSRLENQRLRLKAVYNSTGNGKYNEFSKDEQFINEIVSAKNSGKQKGAFINETCENHKNDDKNKFYPFVHSLLRIIGLDCKNEVQRFDAYSLYNNHIIPAEIKSFTETPTYNLKGIRQAIENKICSYKYDLEDDINYSSFVIGFAHPNSDNDVRNLIDLAFEKWGIKIIASDLFSLVKIAVNIVWDNQFLDLKNFITSYGLLME